MKEIKLQNSTEVVAVVDDEDYERLNKHKWLVDNLGYIYRMEGPSYSRHRVQIHNEILNLPPRSGVDHIDLCKWNNCKENLRVTTYGHNQQNKGSWSTTGFKGVTFTSDRKKKYRVWIDFNHEHMYLGAFETVEEAARVYDKKAVELFGADALTNKKIRGDY